MAYPPNHPSTRKPQLNLIQRGARAVRGAAREYWQMTLLANPPRW